VRRLSERRASRLVLLIATGLALLLVSHLAGLRLNLTGSLPVGLYRAVAAGPNRGGAPAPRRGVIVLACLPRRVAAFAKARGYVSGGGACPGGTLPVGKPVAARPGDTVTVTPAGLLVDGVAVANSRALAADRKGRPLPQLALGRYVVGPGEVWLVSSYSRWSLDSRYFGAVATSDLREAVSALWTAGAEQMHARPDPEPP
jgi:conjugative transfer signal peptidase TraF